MRNLFLCLAVCFTLIGRIASAQTPPSLVVMDDLNADLELIFWAMTKQPIDMKSYLRQTKLLDRNVNLGNAFEENREISRLSGGAQIKQARLMSATFVAIAGPCCFSIEGYDFATKSFHATTDPRVRATVAANARPLYATPTGAHIIFEDEKRAEQIERTRHMHAGTRAQVVDVFRLKSSSKEGVLYSDRVAFVLFGDNGQELLSATFNTVTAAERELLQKVGYNAAVGP